MAWNLVSCSLQSDTSNDVLHISIQPYRDVKRLKELYLPLIQYLEQELKLKVQWVLADSYQQQLDQFHQGKLDLALFGGLAYVRALEKDNADPLVMRDIDFHFTSYFIVAKENKASTIDDLAGSRFSFGSELSTSGHLMPRFFLSTQDIVPERFFSQTLYSGAHQITAQWVQDKKVDIGVLDSVVMDDLFKNKVISKNKVRVLWETPSYPDYIWAARKSLSEKLKLRIIEAFIKLSQDNKQDRKLLDKMGAHYYLPVKSNDFEPVRRIALQLKMLSK